MRCKNKKMKQPIFNSMLAMSAMIGSLNTACQEYTPSPPVNNLESTIEEKRQEFLLKLHEIQRALFNQDDHLPPAKSVKFCIPSHYPEIYGLSYNINQFTIEFIYDHTQDYQSNSIALIKEDNQTLYTIQNGLVFNQYRRVVEENYFVEFDNSQSAFCIIKNTEYFR